MATEFSTTRLCQDQSHDLGPGRSDPRAARAGRGGRGRAGLGRAGRSDRRGRGDRSDRRGHCGLAIKDQICGSDHLSGYDQRTNQPRSKPTNSVPGLSLFLYLPLDTNDGQTINCDGRQRCPIITVMVVNNRS